MHRREGNHTSANESAVPQARTSLPDKVLKKEKKIMLPTLLDY